MNDMLAAVWSYRHFIISSIKNDLRSRFARSKLGALWMILQPLAQVAIYSLVLSRIMAAKLPSDPAMPSARTIAASLPDWMMTERTRSSTRISELS